MAKRVFVLTPAYNAAATLQKVFARMPGIARERVERYVVVNDGSKDATGEVLKSLSAREPKLVALTHEVNRGYGGAMKTLLGYALEHGAEIAIVIHSDGQYSPESIPDLLGPLDEDTADLVQGSRMLGGGALRGGMPLYKFIANKSLTAVENWAFGMGLAEYHSGCMLYARRTLERIPFQKLSAYFDFDLEMIVMAHIAGLRIAEVAIPTIYADEVSHLKPVRYGMRVLSVVRDYKRGRYARLFDR